MRVLLGVLVVTIAGSAHADPPGMTPGLAPPPPPPNELDQFAHNDAASSRGFAFDTGLVIGLGQVDISLRTLVENASDLNVAVGVGAGVVLSVDGIYGLGGRAEALGGGIRMQVLHGPRYAFSVSANYHWAGDEGFDGGYLTFGANLAVALSERVLMSFGLGVERTGGDEGDQDDEFYGHVDLVLGRSWLRMVAEIGDVGTPMAMLGVRYASRHVSVDLGIGEASDDDDSFIPSPAVVFGLAVRP